MARQSRGAINRLESLDYLQSMLGELRLLAQSERLNVLFYLIDMAYLEAGEALRRESAASVDGNQRDSAA